MFRRRTNDTPEIFSALEGKVNHQLFHTWYFYYPSGARTSTSAEVLHRCFLSGQGLRADIVSPVQTTIRASWHDEQEMLVRFAAYGSAHAGVRLWQDFYLRLGFNLGYYFKSLHIYTVGEDVVRVSPLLFNTILGAEIRIL